MQEVLLGGISVAGFLVGLFFFRYWRSTGDRFFVFMMASFWIQSASHIVVALMHSWNEDSPAQYVVRVLAYGLILMAIWTKNRPRA